MRRRLTNASARRFASYFYQLTEKSSCTIDDEAILQLNPTIAQLVERRTVDVCLTPGLTWVTVILRSLVRIRLVGVLYFSFAIIRCVEHITLFTSVGVCVCSLTRSRSSTQGTRRARHGCRCTAHGGTTLMSHIPHRRAAVRYCASSIEDANRRVLQ
jgi:hypothetical protein